MYLAELHGKLSRDNENKEDILTSNVFSFLKYADRKIFLYEFIKQLGLEISEADAANAEFEFWPTFEDKTEPDLVLIIGKYYLLFEAKYYSGFGQETYDKKHQIVREIEGGKYAAQNLKKEFKIIAVTAHYSERSEIRKDVPTDYLDDLILTNWQTIAFMIYQQVEGNKSITPENKLFANDLYELLVRKKLRNFEGTKVLSTIPKALSEKVDTVFFEAKTASYRGSFFGFGNALPDRKLIQPDSLSLYWSSHKP